MPSANDAVWLDVLPDMSKFGPTLAKDAGKQADAAGSKTGKSFGKSMLAGMAIIGAGAALATKGLHSIGATFDDMTDTIRVGTGATGEALDSLADSAKNVGKTTPASFADIGTAIADVNTRLGLTGKPLENISKQFLELSRITGTDVAANIENVSRVFGDWGVSADKQSESLDYLFKVSQSTGIGIDSLSQKVVQFGAPMRQFGFSFEESAALMGKWEKEGVNTETIMGGLRAGLGKLAKAGKDPAKAFEQITKRIKNAGSTGEATAIAIETFGQRAGPDLAAAVREGRFDLDALMTTLDGSSETIVGAGEDTKDFAEHWQIFKNKVMVGLEPIATRVFAALSAGGEWMNSTGIPAFQKMARFVRENSTALTVLGVVVTGLIVVTAAHGAVLAVTAAGGMMAYLRATKIVTTATKVWTAVNWLLTASLLSNPIGLVVLAIVGLIAILVLAWKKSDTFKRIVTAAFGKVHGAAMAVWNWIKKNWPMLLAILTGPIGIAVLAIVRNWDKIKSGASGVKTYVTSKFREIGSAIGQLPGKITALGGRMLSAGKTIMGRLFEGIKSGASAVGGFVSDFASNIASAIKNAANSALGLPKTIGLGGKLGIPRVEFVIPAFARGGMMRRAGLALVGEEGPEIVYLPGGAVVKTAQQTRSIAREAMQAGMVPNHAAARAPRFEARAGGSGATINQTINMPVTTTTDAAYAGAGGRVLAELAATGV